jgi:hypothetical protein
MGLFLCNLVGFNGNLMALGGNHRHLAVSLAVAHNFLAEPWRYAWPIWRLSAKISFRIPPKLADSASIKNPDGAGSAFLVGDDGFS